jgi:hypothetical protein
MTWFNHEKNPAIHHGRNIPLCTVGAVNHKRGLAKPVVKAKTTEQRNCCEELLRVM